MGYLKKLLHDVTVCEVGRMTNWEQAVQNRQKNGKTMKWEASVIVYRNGLAVNKL